MLMTTMTLVNTVKGDMTLTGYLCDHPTRIQDYRVLPFNQSACWAPKAPPIKAEPYSIVQKQTYAMATGTKCSKKVSRFTFVCTHNLVAAHQRMAGVPEIEIPVKVKQEECHTWVTTGKYRGPDGREHQVDMSRTNLLNFNEYGRQEVSGDSIICEGERVKLGDRLIEGVAVLEQVKVTLEKRNFRFTPRSTTAVTVQVQEDHVELPCIGLLHYCETSEATYVWNEIQEAQFQMVQAVEAEIHEEEGQQVLISRQKKVRLALGDLEKFEGRTYQQTRYNNIYVCKGLADYLDPIAASHLKLVAWVSAKDDYLSWALEERILETYDLVSNQRCHREQDMLKNQMATSFTSPEGFHHLHLGGNNFASIIGEAIYRYTCQEVQVQPRATKRCTQELPVRWEQKNFFLEPISRLMKTYGNVVPCSQLLETKFLTKDGGWLSASPRLKYTTAPQQFMDFSQGPNWTHIDMASGGLYTPTQLEDFQRLLNYPRAKKVIADHMVHEVCRDNDHILCNSFNRIAGEAEPQGLLDSWRGRIIRFLHNFGETCAIIIALYVLTSIILWLAGCIWSCRTLQGVQGRRRWIQPLLPIKWVVSYDYGIASRQARKEEEEQRRRNVEMGPVPQQGVQGHHVLVDEEQDTKLLADLQEDDEGFE